RKGQRQRQRAERAGGEQGGRNRQPRPSVAPGEGFGRSAIGGGKDHRQDRKRNRAIEMGNVRVKRDQKRQRREHGGGRPYHRYDGADRTALRQESGDAEAGREHRRRRQVQGDRTIGGKR